MGGLPGVILAGGVGRRIGGGKARRPLGGRTLLAHVQARLAPQVEALAINGDPADLAGFGLTVLPDGTASRPGPLAGVLAALLWAESLGAPAVVTAPCDTPFLPRDLVARLAAVGADGTVPVIAATADGPHPTVALWPVTFVAALRAALSEGRRRVLDVAEAQGARRAVFPDPAAFFNVNTPADLAEAERRLGS